MRRSLLLVCGLSLAACAPSISGYLKERQAQVDALAQRLHAASKAVAALEQAPTGLPCDGPVLKPNGFRGAGNAEVFLAEQLDGIADGAAPKGASGGVKLMLSALAPEPSVATTLAWAKQAPDAKVADNQAGIDGALALEYAVVARPRAPVPGSQPVDLFLVHLASGKVVCAATATGTANINSQGTTYERFVQRTGESLGTYTVGGYGSDLVASTRHEVTQALAKQFKLDLAPR